MAQYPEYPPINIKKYRPFIIIGAVLLFLIIFWNKISVTIESGHAGVLYKQFGNGVDVDAPSYGQGFHFIAPWNKMFIYEVRQKERTESMEILSSNLLKINMDVTILYEPIQSMLGHLEVEKGRDYEQKIIIPILRSVLRNVMGQYLPEEINTTKRVIIEDMVRENMKSQLAVHYIQMNNVLIRNIKLPETLQAAIERKLKQEQESQEYEFRLIKEKKEAERKTIEAEGIKQFQQIITQSINENLLKWKGIEATLELSKSENAKVVVIGSGKDGLPIILGGDK